MKSLWVNISSTSVFTPVTSPTMPKSICEIEPSASCFSINNLRARSKLPSLPVKPMARPPCLLIRFTIDLLTLPPNTISTTSMVAWSVTRIPSIRSDSCPKRFSNESTCGPPPCTTIGFKPTVFNNTMSRANELSNSGSVIALPPYFTTSVFPAKRWIYGKASIKIFALSMPICSCGMRLLSCLGLCEFLCNLWILVLQHRNKLLTNFN